MEYGTWNLEFDPQNILIINFGQIGDVILSLPAFHAVRRKFPNAKITAMIGKSGAQIVEISNLADATIIVDRVRLRDGKKINSIGEILKIVEDARRRRFDFVIDLHSLYETNLFGFVTGAKRRLYGNRESRSLEFLANFTPKPPRENKSLHLTDYYLEILKPLGIENAERFVEIKPRDTDLRKIETLFAAKTSKQIVGLFPGAGNASRRWDLEKFAAAAARFAPDEAIRTIVFLGPEETNLRPAVEEKFPAETMIVDQLSLLEFIAALSKTDVLISNDTGAAHLGAVAGAAIVLVMDKRAPTTYLPLARKLEIVNDAALNEIEIETVCEATRKLLEN